MTADLIILPSSVRLGRKGILLVKKTECLFAGDDDLTGASQVLTVPTDTITATVIHNGLTFWYPAGLPTLSWKDE